MQLKDVKRNRMCKYHVGLFTDKIENIHEKLTAK